MIMIFETEQKQADATNRKLSCSELVYFRYDKKLTELWQIVENNYLFFTKFLFVSITCLLTKYFSSRLIIEKP